MSNFQLKTISSVCPANDNLVFDAAVGCKYRAILANQQCDTPIQMGTIWARVDKGYMALYYDHYWCVEDTDNGTIIYDTPIELQRFFKEHFIDGNRFKSTIVNHTPFVNKDIDTMNVLEISGEDWINKTPYQFEKWLDKTYRDSKYDLIYVADLMYAYNNPNRFSTMGEMESEFNKMYITLSKWLEVNNPTEGVVLGGGEYGVEF